jgi:hypothetical protein
MHLRMLTSHSVLHVVFFVWNCSDAVSGLRPGNKLPEVTEESNKEWAREADKEMRHSLKGKDVRKSFRKSAPWTQSQQNLLDMPKPAFALQEDAERSSLSLSIFGTEPDTPAVPAIDRRASRMSQKSIAESIYALPELPPPVPTLHLDRRHKGGKGSQGGPRQGGPDVLRNIATPSPVFGGHIRGYSNLSSSSFSPQFLAASIKNSSKALPLAPTSTEKDSNSPIDSRSESQHPRNFSPPGTRMTSHEPRSRSPHDSGEILMDQLESHASPPPSSTYPPQLHDSDFANSPASSRPVSSVMTNRPRSRAWSFSQASVYPDDDDDTASMIRSVEPFQELPRQSFGSHFSGNWMSSLTRGESISASSMRSKAASTRSKAPSTRSRATSKFLEPGGGGYVPPMPGSNRTSVSARSEARKSLAPSTLRE